MTAADTTARPRRLARLRATARRGGVALAAGAVVLAGAATVPHAAQADTAPVGRVPTVSADGLPTVQVDGIVRAQVLVGNTVYATGAFRYARPAGTAPGDPAQVERRNLLAYDIRTGNLLPFNHRISDAGYAISVSPNRKRLYVGGDFLYADGRGHRHVVAIDLTVPGGKTVHNWYASTNARVTALAAHNYGVYVGGGFSKARNYPRRRLANFNLRGFLTAWKPTANATVRSLLVTPDRSKVIVAGNMTEISGYWFWGFGAVDRSSGKAILTWRSHFRNKYRLRNGGPGSGIWSVSTDGTRLYLAGYQNSGRQIYGHFEGRAAVSLKDGRLLWIADCHGDTYDTVPVGGVLYSVGHPHDCEPLGYFPELGGDKPKRALAESTARRRTNGPATNGYASYEGLPAPNQFDWYPSLSPGSVSGAAQAAWDIVGNSRYIALGGEFPRVNGVDQQGLVRFAVSDIAPNKVGPEPFDEFGPNAGSGATVDVQPASPSGESTVSWEETWDKDNERLTYELVRIQPGADEVVPCTGMSAVPSVFWHRDVMTCTDTGRPTGSKATYRVTATDPFGNVRSTTSP